MKPDEKIAGDALREPIPKSDLILSNWTLGYVGHPDYMTRKIAQALKPGGMAVLHFNSFLSEGKQVPRFSNFLDLLVQGKIIIPNCEVKAVKVDGKINKSFKKADKQRYHLWKGPVNVGVGDYLVAIKKKSE